MKDQTTKKYSRGDHLQENINIIHASVVEVPKMSINGSLQKVGIKNI